MPKARQKRCRSCQGCTALIPSQCHDEVDFFQNGNLCTAILFRFQPRTLLSHHRPTHLNTTCRSSPCSLPLWASRSLPLWASPPPPQASPPTPLHRSGGGQATSPPRNLKMSQRSLVQKMVDPRGSAGYRYKCLEKQSFPCQVCDEVCTTSYNLTRHIKIHHSGSGESLQ